jgi:hypothetical protein
VNVVQLYIMLYIHNVDVVSSDDIVL